MAHTREPPFEQLLYASPLPVIVYDPTSLCIAFVNDAAVAEYGYSREEFERLTIAQIRPPEEAPALHRALGAEQGPRSTGIWRHRRRDGSEFDADITASEATIDGWLLRIAVIRPADPRRRGDTLQQQRLQRSREQARTLTRLATCPEMAEGRLPAALDAVLRGAAEALRVRRVSFWRLDDRASGLRRERGLDLASDVVDRCPQVIRTSDCPRYLDALDGGRVMSVNDVLTDPRTTELHGYFDDHGIGALLDASVRVRGAVVGVLCHEHVGPPREWEEDEVRFAGEVADQIAQAILNAERRRYTELLEGMAAMVGPETGDTFFRALVATLSRILDTACVFIAQPDAARRDTAHTLALARHGEIEDNIAFPLPGSLCERVLEQGLHVVPRDLAEQHPEEPWIATDTGRPAQSYLGMRLTDRDGTTLGALVAVGHEPVTEHEEATSLLRLFADRAAVELVRLRQEPHLIRAAAVMDNTSEGIAVTRPDGTIVEGNPALSAITGYPPHELEQHTLFELIVDHQACNEVAVRARLERHGRWQGEVWTCRRDGERFPAWVTITRAGGPAPAGAEGQLVALISDVSDIRRSQADLRHLAHHDALTDLPNRTLFNDRITHALRTADRSGGCVAVLFLDIDGFKDVNDSLGHSEGDTLLRRVAQRLRQATREGDTLARIGGDEFMVLLERLDSEDDVTPVVQRLTEVFTPFFRVGQHEIFITASVGISLYPRDGQSAETLIQNADAAMYAAKSAGKNTFRFFMPALTERAFERVALVAALRAALEAGQFELQFQAQVTLADARVNGCEALVRWRHPERGMVPPGEFIGVAESSGLIVPLGQWVLREACRQGRAWLDAGFDFGRIAVNVAAAQILRPGFAEEVLATLDETGLPAQRLTIEITESLFLDPQSPVAETLALVRGAGVEIAIDDFGTGYSSLAYIKRLPIDILKLDKSFTRDLPGDADDISIARAIVGLADTLGLAVIAEGVETESQQAFLQTLGCHRGQGFLFGHPLPPADFERATRRGPRLVHRRHPTGTGDS